MPQISLVTGSVEWRVEIKVITIRPKTEMGSDGAVDYYVTEWKDPYGMINQTWRMNPHGGTVYYVPDFQSPDF